MARRLFLHVGTVKSATTYLQAICDDNAARLADEGLLWLGSAANFSAVADLFGTTRPDEYGAAALSWSTLVERIGAHDGDALVSNELLSLRGPKKVRAFVQALPPTSTRVVVTARDFARVTVSQWQEHVRHRPTGPWADFMGRLTTAGSRDDPEMAWFWRRQDVPRLVKIWAEQVGIDNVTVVTVPSRDVSPDALVDRFFGVVGVADTGALTVPELADNASLGTYSVELVRRIQQRLDDDDRARLHLVLKYLLTRRALAERASDEPALTLTPDQVDWARAQAAEMAGRLDELGVRIVGDVDDLMPRMTGSTAAAPPSDDELLDAAVDALIRLADATDDLARAVGGERYGDTVRAVGGRGRPQP
ncbi:MAG TPA: hypothetical protein VLK34_03635 [Nocardioidaceae bacterium]|nr:hypothetical protein [Nocardioidaceae bacterium]